MCYCGEQCSSGAPIRRKDRGRDLQPVRGPGEIALSPIIASMARPTRSARILGFADTDMGMAQGHPHVPVAGQAGDDRHRRTVHDRLTC